MHSPITSHISSDISRISTQLLTSQLIFPSTYFSSRTFYRLGKVCFSAPMKISKMTSAKSRRTWKLMWVSNQSLLSVKCVLSRLTIWQAATIALIAGRIQHIMITHETHSLLEQDCMVQSSTYPVADKVCRQAVQISQIPLLSVLDFE